MVMVSGGFGRSVAAGVVLCASTVMLSGCLFGSDGSGGMSSSPASSNESSATSSVSSPSPSPSPSSTSSFAAAPVSFKLVVPKGGVAPLIVNDVVGFTAAGGSVESVQFVDPQLGDKVKWVRGKGVYRVTGVLTPKHVYRVRVVGRSVEGVQRSEVFSLRVGDGPRGSASVNVGDGQTVGVGMPIVLTFNKPVTDRRAVEEGLKVVSSPVQEGSWGWVNAHIVAYRPKDFWKPGTNVSVTTAYKDRFLGGNVWGGSDRSVKFKVGRDFRMFIDDRKHSMNVVDRGKVVKVMPVSMGKPGKSWVTRSGVKIITQKATPYTMRGPASDPYVTKVTYAQRLTDSGEFFHSAPWSVGAQGYRNVSHGCVNLSPGNAKWLYGRTLPGDVVTTVNTGRKMESWNGPSGVWNVSYSVWRKNSAL